MSTQIERYSEQPLALIESIDDLARLSKQVAESNYYGDMRSAQQAAVKLMIARELGLGLTAISNVHLVDGKIQLGYQILIALVKRSGKYNLKFVERTDTCVRIEWFEDGESVGFSKFDMEDAKRARLLGTKSANFEKYPIRMLTARAVSDGFSTFAPECAGGALYTDGEISQEIEPEPAPRRKRERAAATTHQAPPKEQVVDAEIVVDAPVAPETAESRVAPDEPASTTIDLPAPVVAVSHVLKDMDWQRRKLVKARIAALGIEWNDQTPAALVAHFDGDDDGLVALLKADENGEMPSAERFDTFIAETTDATLEDVRDAMAAAGEFGS